MVDLGLCNANLKDGRTLMKMGLSMVLLGHINFLLGALVHGAVLRHISLHKQARLMEYAVSNVIALVAGMVGAIVGISAIVLSKNRKSKMLTWFLLVVSALCSLLAAAAVLGLTVSVVNAIANGGRTLLTHCKFPDAIGYSSITNECPFDPTRIYSTTIFLWVPMVLLSLVELVFSGRSCGDHRR
ncbi:keratinocyte-associated protein 3-like isoform X2 [Conger conger]|uniref:keratinocyte-associated protein 3-like isoform X2 n=1 Tax=Conger conger TaxID=82655 RepID=UPI002A5A777B|nr:keratinocyte-associated protein 3-like isoform X2 [Conger conger]